MRRRQAFGYEGAAFFLHSDSSNSDEGYFGGLGMEEHQDNENPHGRGRPRGRGRQHRGRGRGGQNIGPFAPPINPHQAQLGNQGNFPIINPGNVPIANPGNVPIANPGNVPIANPGNVPIANPGNVPIANPGNVPIANPGNVPIANPGNVSIANPGNVSIANPGNVPIAHPGNVRFANPGNVLFVNQAQGPYMNQGNVFNVQRHQAQYTNQAYVYANQGLGQPMIRNNFPNAKPAQMQQMNQMQGLNPDQVQMHAIVPGPSQMQAVNQSQGQMLVVNTAGQGQLHTIHQGQDQVHVFNPNQGQIPVSNSGQGQMHVMQPGQGQMHAVNSGHGHMHVMNPSPRQLHTINQSQSQRNTLNPGQGHNRFISPDQDQMHALNPSQVQNFPQSHDVSINQDHGHDQDQDQDPPTNQSGASSASKVSELRITIPSHDQPMNVNVAPTVSQAQMSTIGRPILPPARQVENVNQGNNPNVGQDLVSSFGNVSIASTISNENVLNAPNVNPVQTQHANTGNLPHLNQGQDQSNDRGRPPNIQPNQEQRMKPSAVPEISQSQNVPSQRVDQRQDKKLGANRSPSSNVLPGQCGTNQGLPPRERPVLLQTPSVAPGGSPPKRGGFGPKNMFYVNMGGAHYDFFTGGHRRNTYSNRGVRVDRRSASVRGHIRPNYAPARVRRLSENADVRRKKTETASAVVTKSDPSTSGSGDDASEKVKDSKCNKKKAHSSPVATGGENPGKNQQENVKNKKSSSGGNSGSASTNSGDDTSGGNEGSNESDNSNDSKSDKGKTDRARRKSGGNKSVAGKDSRGDSKNVRQSTKSGSGTDVSEGSASSGGGADSGVKSGSKGSGSGDNGGNGGSDVSDSSGDSGERKDGSGSSGGDSGGGSGGSGSRGGCGRGGNGPYGGGSGGGGGSGAGGSGSGVGGSGSGAGGCGDNSGGSGGTGGSSNSGNGGNMGNDGNGGNGGSGSKGNSDGNDGSGGKRNSRFPSGSGGSDRNDGNVGNGGNVGKDGNENKNDGHRHTGQDQSIQGCASQVGGTVLETEGSVERDPATERKTSNRASGNHHYKSNLLHSRGVNAQAHSRMNLPMDPNALPPGFVLTHNPKNIVEGRSVNTAGESDLVVDETGYHSSPRFGYYNGMLVNLDLAHLTVPEFIDVSQTNPPPENIPINLNTVPEVLKALTQYLIQNHPSSEASQIVLSKKELRPMYDENTQRTIDASVQNVQQEQPTIIGAPKYPVPNAPLLPTPHRMPLALENVHFAPRVESAAQLNAPVYPAPSNVQFVPSQPLIHEPLRTASIPSQFNVPPPSGMDGFLPPFNNRMPMHVPNNNPHLLSAPQSGFNLNAPGNVFIRPQANFVQPGAESVTGKQVHSPVPIYQVNNNTRFVFPTEVYNQLPVNVPPPFIPNMASSSLINVPPTSNIFQSNEGNVSHPCYQSANINTDFNRVPIENVNISNPGGFLYGANERYHLIHNTNLSYNVTAFENEQQEADSNTMNNNDDTENLVSTVPRTSTHCTSPIQTSSPQYQYNESIQTVQTQDLETIGQLFAQLGSIPFPVLVESMLKTVTEASWERILSTLIDWGYGISRVPRETETTSQPQPESTLETPVTMQADSIAGSPSTPQIYEQESWSQHSERDSAHCSPPIGNNRTESGMQTSPSDGAQSTSLRENPDSPRKQAQPERDFAHCSPSGGYRCIESGVQTSPPGGAQPTSLRENHDISVKQAQPERSLSQSYPLNGHNRIDSGVQTSPPGRAQSISFIDNQNSSKSMKIPQPQDFAQYSPSIGNIRTKSSVNTSPANNAHSNSLRFSQVVSQKQTQPDRNFSQCSSSIGNNCIDSGVQTSPSDGIRSIDLRDRQVISLKQNQSERKYERSPSSSGINRIDSGVQTDATQSISLRNHHDSSKTQILYLPERAFVKYLPVKGETRPMPSVNSDTAAGSQFIYVKDNRDNSRSPKKALYGSRSWPEDRGHDRNPSSPRGRSRSGHRSTAPSDPQRIQRENSAKRGQNMTDTKITILSRSNTHVNKDSKDSVSFNTTNQLKGTDLPKNYDRTCDAPTLSVLKQVPGHADNSVVKEKLKAKASTVPTDQVDRINENSALKCKSGSRQDIQFASIVENASNECISQKTERRASCSNQGVGSKAVEERAEKPIERYIPPTKLARDEGNAFCEKSVRFDLSSDVSDSVRRTDISKSSIIENQKKKVPTGVFPTPRDEDFPALPSFGNRKKLLVEDSSAKAPIPKRRPVGEGAFAKTSNTYFRNMPEETNLDKKKPEQCEPNKDKHCHTTEKPIRPRLTLGGPYTNLFTVDSPSICLGHDGCGLCANFTIEIDEAFPDRGTYASGDSEDDDTPADSDEDRNSDEWSDGDGCDQFPLPRLPSPGINTPGNTKPAPAHPQHNAPDSRTEHSSVSKSASLEGDFLGSKHSVRHLYRGQDIANTGPGESNIDRGKDGHHQNLKNKRGDSTGSWADQTEEPQNEDCSGADGLGKLRQFLAEHDVGGAKDKQNTVPGGDARDVEDYLFRVSQSPSTSRP